MSNSDGNLLSFIAGAAVGALVGMGIGVLIAPDKGEKTREMISNKSHEFKDELEHQVENSKDRLERFAHNLADRIKASLERENGSNQETSDKKASKA